LGAAEFYLDAAQTLAALPDGKGVGASAHLFEAATAASLVSLAQTLMEIEYLMRHRA
jgi:hypothetical protein